VRQVEVESLGQRENGRLWQKVPASVFSVFCLHLHFPLFFGRGSTARLSQLPTTTNWRMLPLAYIHILDPASRDCTLVPGLRSASAGVGSPVCKASHSPSSSSSLVRLSVVTQTIKRRAVCNSGRSTHTTILQAALYTRL
jgi:hypothetical protein